MIRFDTKKDYDKYFEDIQKIIDLEKENQQLQNNWNELKKWLKEVEEVRYYMTCHQRYEVFIDKILNKMQELEEGNK